MRNGNSWCIKHIHNTQEEHADQCHLCCCGVLGGYGHGRNDTKEQLHPSDSTTPEKRNQSTFVDAPTPFVAVTYSADATSLH